jgi:hypothetical protein
MSYEKWAFIFGILALIVAVLNYPIEMFWKYISKNWSKVFNALGYLVPLVNLVIAYLFMPLDKDLLFLVAFHTALLLYAILQSRFQYERKYLGIRVGLFVRTYGSTMYKERLEKLYEINVEGMTPNELASHHADLKRLGEEFEIHKNVMAELKGVFGEDKL